MPKRRELPKRFDDGGPTHYGTQMSYHATELKLGVHLWILSPHSPDLLKKDAP